MISRNALRFIDSWNRKLHNYVGLFLLTFIWLFSISGVILNHPTWEFSRFWPSRVESSTDLDIQIPADGTDIDRAHNLMSQAGVSGEIERITSHKDEASPGLDVRILRPGRITDIKADFGTGKAVVHQTQTNTWGVVHWLHHFTGVRMERPELERDWIMTSLWSLSIDAICIGLIFLVASSLYMWYPQIRKRRLGWGFLGTGLFTCWFFVFGLSWIF